MFWIKLIFNGVVYVVWICCYIDFVWFVEFWDEIKGCLLSSW